MKNKKQSSTEQALVSRFHEGNKVRKRLEEKFVKKSLVILNSKKPAVDKVSAVFTEFLEMYHQGKMYWLKKHQVTK